MQKALYKEPLLLLLKQAKCKVLVMLLVALVRLLLVELADQIVIKCIIASVKAVTMLNTSAILTFVNLAFI